MALPQIFFMQGYQELSSFPDRRLFCAHKQPRSSISARSHLQHWRTTSLPQLPGQPLTVQAQDKMTPVRWSRDKRQTPGLMRKYIHLIRSRCFLKYSKIKETVRTLMQKCFFFKKTEPFEQNHSLLASWQNFFNFGKS